jgi:hypothetical protein
MQRLLRYARWDADAVRDDVRAYVVDRLGDGGVLIVDETGFVKKGSMSAGVQRQYTGTAGRIENSQVGVFLAYATERGRALIDRRLYLPERSWCPDPGRRRAAGVPEDVQFATKPHLAGEMIAAALDAGVTASWVTGDEAYGQDPQLRARLERIGIGYVMAVACSTRVRINHGRTPVRADVLADRLPASAWQRHSAGAGAKGPRFYDWAWIHIGTGVHRHLLIRRNRTTGELALYLCWSPTEVALSELVRVAPKQDRSAWVRQALLCRRVLPGRVSTRPPLAALRPTTGEHAHRQDDRHASRCRSLPHPDLDHRDTPPLACCLPSPDRATTISSQHDRKTGFTGWPPNRADVVRPRQPVRTAGLSRVPVSGWLGSSR